MAEQIVRVSPEVELCCETFGDPAAPPMLLVMGLGTQMLAWDVDFCAQLAAGGFFVIRYDNRDVGRSTHFTDTPPPGPRELVTRRPKHVAYTLGDMAADGTGLLDALGLESAHVVGASMGGMIAQTMAAQFADRVRSLTSIMSNTGARFTGQPSPRVMPWFLRRPARTREAAVEATVQLFRMVGSPGFPRDEDLLREHCHASLDRDDDATGSGRQLAAIMAAGDRTREVRTITAPTLVIHGSADRLVGPSGGRATHKAIRGSRLLVVEGMGHDLPRGAWPQLVEAIEDHARAADAARAGTAAAA